jgi:hypothetical protein
VAGAKGVWILDPNDRSPSEPPRIWIRKSQRKIKLPRLEESPAQRIFDLVTQSTRIGAPAHLNIQLIINLAENGVDARVFQDLLHEGLTRLFASLTQWDGPGAMPLLWNTVNNQGGVTRARLQRVAHSLARAIGLASRFEMDREDEDDDDDDDNDDNDSSDDEEKSLYQFVLELIQAGFTPQHSPILYQKMQYVVKQAMDRHLKNYYFEVPQSAVAFIVPGMFGNLYVSKISICFPTHFSFVDPFGVLEEGQIHFRSSQELGDPLTETNVYSIRGPVLVGRYFWLQRRLTPQQVGRNPTMVASDIQKVISKFSLDFSLAEPSPRLRQLSTRNWRIISMLSFSQ